MPRSHQDSARECVPETVEGTTVPNAAPPIELTPIDTPGIHEERRQAEESESRGKVVIITGAGAGIGRATAMRFAAEGARIAAWDVSAKSAPQLESAIDWAGGESQVQAVDVGNASGGESARAGVGGGGGESQFQAVDVANASAVESAAAAVVERWGRIDVLINNAGIVRDAQLVKWNGGSPESIMREKGGGFGGGGKLKGGLLVSLTW